MSQIIAKHRQILIEAFKAALACGNLLIASITGKKVDISPFSTTNNYFSTLTVDRIFMRSGHRIGNCHCQELTIFSVNRLMRIFRFPLNLSGRILNFSYNNLLCKTADLAKICITVVNRLLKSKNGKKSFFLGCSYLAKKWAISTFGFVILNGNRITLRSYKIHGVAEKKYQQKAKFFVVSGGQHVGREGDKKSKYTRDIQDF